MIKVFLSVETTVLSIEDLTAHLQREPTSYERKGVVTPSGRPLKWNFWDLEIVAEPGMRLGLYGIDHFLRTAGMEFANRLGSIPDPDAGVVLKIVQTIDDDPEDVDTSNFHISPEGVRWLAAANAHIDITQYLYEDE